MTERRGGSRDGATLRFSRLASPADDVLRFALEDPYVEFVYTPILGPTAVALLRRLGLLLVGGSPNVEVEAATLSRELGLRSTAADAVGERSALMRALARLERQRLVLRDGVRQFGVYLEVPALSGQQFDRLPESARLVHHERVRSCRAGRCDSER